jgi:poly-gamma-glutamate synthesis protein (capsule biosynthesis protein)
MIKTQSFLLILISSFLIILVYVTGHITQYGPVNLFEDKTVKIILTGDIMLGRSVMTQSLKRVDPKYPFLKVADRLNSADIVFANLEAPFVEGCQKTDTGVKFCADPSLVEGLSYGNVSVVSLSNNHMNNYGQAGLAETKKVLTGAGIDYIGDGNLAVKEINGIKFGFLGFNFISRRPTALELKMIADSKKLVDVLVVGVHWGTEYQAEPNTTQKEIAKQIIASGADVIAGHHPHWVQTVEKIQDKPVYYSLGNFVFDQPWSEETKEGLAVELTFSGKTLVKEEKLPVYIEKLGQPILQLP